MLIGQALKSLFFGLQIAKVVDEQLAEQGMLLFIVWPSITDLVCQIWEFRNVENFDLNVYWNLYTLTGRLEIVS